MKKNYADVKADLSMVMYKHALDRLCKKTGFIAFITTSSWMFLSSFEKLRQYQQQNACISSLVDYGTELFDGKVGHNPIVSWVVRNTPIDAQMTAVRLVDYCYSNRDQKEPEFFESRNRYFARQSNFSKIPGSPVAYWVGEAFGNAFDNKTLYEFAPTKQGIATAKNDEYLRLWHEVNSNNVAINNLNHEQSSNRNEKWYPYNKGGIYRKWYGNRDWYINWKNDGFDLKNFPNSVIRNPSYYFNIGITWSDITSGLFSARYSEEGFIHDSTGPMCFPLDKNLTFYLLAVLNCKPAAEFLQFLAPTFHFREGPVGSLPVRIEHKEDVDALVTENIAISRADWDSFETSWDFVKHPLL